MTSALKSILQRTLQLSVVPDRQYSHDSIKAITRWAFIEEDEVEETLRLLVMTPKASLSSSIDIPNAHRDGTAVRFDPTIGFTLFSQLF